MSHLIPITKTLLGNEEVNSVNARDLHIELNIKKRYSDWIKAQIQRGELTENNDFVVFHQKGINPTGGRPSNEYILTLEAAKQIAMMSQSKKGNEVRRYFVQVEQRYIASLKQQAQLTTPTDLSRVASLLEQVVERLAVQPDPVPTRPLPLRHSSSWQRWDAEEDSLLITLKTEGLTFYEMLPHFPNRTHKAISKRWSCIRGLVEAQQPHPAVTARNAHPMRTYMLRGTAFKCLQYIKDQGGIDGHWVRISYSDFQIAGIAMSSRSSLISAISYLVEQGFIGKRIGHSNTNQYTIIEETA